MCWPEPRSRTSRSVWTIPSTVELPCSESKVFASSPMAGLTPTRSRMRSASQPSSPAEESMSASKRSWPMVRALFVAPQMRTNMFRRLTGILVVAAGLSGAAEDPVQWTFQFDAKSAAPGSHALGRLVAKVDPGWHVYSLTTPKGGPNPTTVTLAENPAVASFKVYQPKPERKFDPNFQLDTETFADQAVLLLDVEFKKDAAAGPAELTAQVRYQCCNDRLCLPPKRKSAPAAVTIDPTAG